MRTAWQWLLGALAVIAALFGANWVRDRLEARGAKKQQKKQQELADKVEVAIAEEDAEIDTITNKEILKVQAERSDIQQAIEEELRGTPTQDEVQRLIDESKK